MSDQDYQTEMWEAFLQNMEQSKKAKPLPLEVYFFPEDERLRALTFDEVMKDKEPKHPEVIKVGGGAYFRVMWAVTLNPETDPDKIMFLRAAPISLN